MSANSPTLTRAFHSCSSASDVNCVAYSISSVAETRDRVLSVLGKWNSRGGFRCLPHQCFCDTCRFRTNTPWVMSPRAFHFIYFISILYRRVADFQEAIRLKKFTIYLKWYLKYLITQLQFYLIYINLLKYIKISNKIRRPLHHQMLSHRFAPQPGVDSLFIP